MIPNYLHTLTLPTPFPVGPVNVYLVVGAEPTLIDTGPNDGSTLAALRDQFAARGLTFQDIRRLIITHAHVDHFGLAAHIVNASDAKVYSHPRNRAWLTDFVNEWDRRRDFYRDVFATGGAPRALTDGVGEGMRRMIHYGVTIPAEHFVPVVDTDILDLGGDSWHVLFLPGHASGLICLYEPKSRTLISSDHLLRDITSNPTIEPPTGVERERPQALVSYIASMQRTAELHVEVALPGHGEPIRDVRALIEDRLAFHRARLDIIEGKIRDGAETAYDLMQSLFADLKATDVFLGLSEVIGHLDILQADGRIAREQKDGIYRYFPTHKK